MGCGVMGSTTIHVERWDGDVWLVVLCGEHDISTAADLEHALSRVESQVGRTVIVDLAETQFLDSTTLSLILRTRCDGGRTMVVAPDGSRVSRLFRIVNLGPEFPIYGSRDEAVQALVQPLG
jgi:anti-anti-sigma factor